MFKPDIFLKFASYNQGKFELIKKDENVLLYSYIYAIVMGNDLYVGSTDDIWSRVRNHKISFERWKQTTKLQIAFNTKKQFDIYILMRLRHDTIHMRCAEQFFISLLEPSLNSAPAASLEVSQKGFIWGLQSSHEYFNECKHKTLKKSKPTNDNVKALCKLQGITQKQLAEKIGMKESTFNIALGKASFNIPTLEKIAAVFNITVSELLAEDTGHQNPPAVVEKEVSYLRCPNCGKKINIWTKADDDNENQD